ncbi:HAD family phosphatase [Geotalea sp. SG265]|uniref:HAD family hydrolase n=1 Tax=Geotalea sp. SG265 TaxID=2922867 RepID=UPI001FAE8A99|nr:HAD family phosphatase [Geotalea sp. SG265]
MPAAVIFDFDGIIVDTEPLHYKAFQEVLVPLGLGYSWEEYVGHYIGFDDRDAFREAYAAGGKALDADELSMMIGKKAAAFNCIIAAGVTPFPGVVELIRTLKGTCPIGLCSGALASDIAPILQQLHIGGVFDILVTADEVAASKPDPESYQLAVKRLAEAFPALSIAPARCLAIEDTPAGIASATAAGLKVLAVTNSYPEEKLGAAARVVESLVGIDLTGLDALFR